MAHDQRVEDIRHTLLLVFGETFGSGGRAFDLIVAIAVVVKDVQTVDPALRRLRQRVVGREHVAHIGGRDAVLRHLDRIDDRRAVGRVLVGDVGMPETGAS